METLEAELKRLIIDIFELEGLAPSDIAADAALFGGSLGLDSIDALELGLALKKKYNIYIDSHTSDLVEHFASIRHLAGFVASQLEKQTV